MSSAARFSVSLPYAQKLLFMFTLLHGRLVKSPSPHLAAVVLMTSPNSFWCLGMSKLRFFKSAFHCWQTIRFLANGKTCRWTCQGHDQGTANRLERLKLRGYHSMYFFFFAQKNYAHEASHAEATGFQSQSFCIHNWKDRQSLPSKIPTTIHHAIHEAENGWDST